MTEGTYKHPKYGWTVALSHGWAAASDDLEQATFVPPGDLTEASPRLQVVVQDLTTSPMTQSEFTEVCLFHLRRIKEGIEAKETTLAGLRADVVEFTASDAGGPPTTIRQSWVVKDSVALVATYSALEGHFAAHSEAADALLASLSLDGAHTVSYVDHSAVLYMVPQYDAEHLLVVRVPATWASEPMQRSPSGSATQFAFRGPLTERPGEPAVLMKLLVSVATVPLGTTLAAYTELVQRQLQEIRAVGTPISGAELGGREARRVCFRTDLLREGRRFWQVWTVNGRDAVTLTFVEAADDEETRPMRVFERIEETFAFVRPEDEVSTHVLYENLEHSVSMLFPDCYAPCEGFLGSLVTFISKRNKVPQFQSTLGILVKSRGTFTLPELCSVLREQILDQPGSELESSKDIVLGGNPAMLSQYSVINEGLPGKFAQWVSIVGERAVVLNFTAEKESFEDVICRDGIERCVNSFRFF
eukprot:m51a1_g9352 hypothetical protein (474) ;mRNA; f:122299-123928